MKRFACFLLSLALLLPAAGLAASVDVAALSDADLESLYNAVLAERLARMKFNSFLVEKGEYRIGIDVPAGAFRVVHEGKTETNIAVYDSPDSLFSSYNGQVASPDSGMRTSAEIGRLVLPDGGVLKLERGSARFYVETGGVTFD